MFGKIYFKEIISALRAGNQSCRFPVLTSARILCFLKTLNDLDIYPQSMTYLGHLINEQHMATTSYKNNSLDLQIPTYEKKAPDTTNSNT